MGKFKLIEEERRRKMTIIGEKDPRSESFKFRQDWLKKGYDLVNITEMCVPKLGVSGWMNDFNEPDEQCYHIQLWYRNEVIANLCSGEKIYILDDSKYTTFTHDDDFAIYMKVKL